MKRIYDFFRLWIIWKDPKEAWQDSKTINDKEFQNDMSKINNRLEELLDSIPEEKWSSVRLNIEAKKTHRLVQETVKKRKHAIDFAEWILTHEIDKSTNDDNIHWMVNNGEETTTHTTTELYGIYLRGDLDDYNEEE